MSLDIILIHAIREGRVEEVEEIIQNVGLSHSPNWSGGYVLLCEALKYHKVEVAKLLINKNCNLVNTCGNISDTPLHLAVSIASLEIVEFLLNKYVDINAKNKFGETPLHVSVWEENIEVIKCLLSHGACVNIKTEKGHTPLHLALEYGKTKMAELLLKHHTDVNVATKNNETPLHVACRKRYTTIAEHLLNHGANVNFLNHKGHSPLHLASERNDVTMIELLLKHHTNVNIAAKDNETPLHVACKERCTAAAEHLLNHGANVNFGNHKGHTALHLASECKDVTMVELLLKHNPNVNFAAKNNETALHVACETSIVNDNTVVIVNHLLNHGANINCKTCKGYTPLHLALECGNKMITELLLKHHPDVNIAADNNETPLHVACKEGYRTAAEHLLSHEANINFGNHEGHTPLHLATENGHYKIISLLLDKGADVNAVTMNGSTPLLIATNHRGFHFHLYNDCNTSEYADLLLEHGALVNVKNKDGQTPLYSSIKKKDKKLINRFLMNDLDINLNTPAFIYAIEECDDSSIVYDLIKHGFTVDTENSNNAKLLSSVIRKGYVSVFKDILKFGINVNSSFGNEKYSLLHAAAKYEQEEITDLLIQNGADLNAKDNLGASPLCYAIRESNLLITKILLSNGAGVSDQYDALHMAAKSGCRGIIEELLKYNADINGLDKRETTPLYWAVSKGHEDCVRTLIKHGADVNKIVKGENLLHTAAAKNHPCILKYLLKFIYFLNNKSREDMTPLIIAVKYKHLQNVCILLDHDVDVNVQMNNGDTALHVAVRIEETDIVKELLKYNINMNTSYSTRSLYDIAWELMEYYEYRFYSDEAYYEYQLSSDEEYDDYNYSETTQATCEQRVFYSKYLNIQNIYNLLKTKVKLETMNSSSDTMDEDDSSEDSIDLTHYRGIIDGLLDNKCKKEINKMKRTSVYNNVSYYDILTGTKRKLLLYARNDNILKEFESDTYKQIFPMYNDYLEMNLQEGIKRNNLLKVGRKILNYVFKTEMPDLVAEEIMSYLSNLDLRKLQHNQFYGLIAEKEE